MKKIFDMPEINIGIFSIENIITTSGVGGSLEGSKYEGTTEDLSKTHTVLSTSWADLF